MSVKKRGLGRGLDALLNASSHAEVSADASGSSSSERGELRKLPIEWLQPGKYQPRKDMSPEALEELTHSIRAQGIIQPIVVRPIAEQQFEIIAGERRWRASQQAGLDKVPCLIKDVSDESAVAIALIENIQREDLNAMEEAVALQQLLNEFELTHQQVADAVGKSRATVTNTLRLNTLESDVKILLEHGDLEMGHARALLSVSGENQVELARRVAAKGLSVRETERLIKNDKKQKDKSKTPTEKDVNTERLEQNLSDFFGAQVKIQKKSQGKGCLVINYSDLDQLDGILRKFSPNATDFQ